jgi:hypothetical protein
MTLRTVHLFGTGSANKSPTISSQKRTNLYLCPSKDGEKAPYYLAPTPGLTEKKAATSYGSAVCRGSISVNDVIYSVHGNKLYSTNASYTVTNRGTINTSSGPVSMAWNGTEICLVDGTDGWTYNVGTNTLTEITDADFPSSPTTVTFLAGRFIVNKGGTGQFYWSDLLDGSAWDPLDFATAESQTDDLAAVAADHGSLVLLGDTSTEFWAANPNAGSSAEAFIRVGGSGIEWGCASFQSIAQYDTGLIFLAKNRLGESRVIKLSGYSAVPVDEPDICYAINGQTGHGSATGYTYVMNGQMFYQLNVGNISLLYDGIGWNYVSFHDSGARHLGNFVASLNNQPHIFGHFDDTLYLLDKNELRDGTTSIVREVITRHVFEAGNPTTIWKLLLHAEAGAVRDNAAAADCSLYVSKDGGKTFSSAYIASMGNNATPVRAVWRRLGRAVDWVFKFRVTAYRLTITGASMEIEG